MDSAGLRAVQEPLKDAYRKDPREALVTLRAHGQLDEQAVACSVATGREPAVAGLHPATGGDGSLLCSGDMLLQALVACAGVTLRAVATSLGIPLAGGHRHRRGRPGLPRHPGREQGGAGRVQLRPAGLRPGYRGNRRAGPGADPAHRALLRHLPDAGSTAGADDDRRPGAGQPGAGQRAAAPTSAGRGVAQPAAGPARSRRSRFKGRGRHAAAPSSAGPRKRLLPTAACQQQAQPRQTRSAPPPNPGQVKYPPICAAVGAWQSRLKSAQSWPIWACPQPTTNARPCGCERVGSRASRRALAYGCERLATLYVVSLRPSTDHHQATPDIPAGKHCLPGVQGEYDRLVCVSRADCHAQAAAPRRSWAGLCGRPRQLEFCLTVIRAGHHAVQHIPGSRRRSPAFVGRAMAPMSSSPR